MQHTYKIALKALLLVIGVAASVAHSQDVQPTTVLFENVRIFDGTSSSLSAPSNVLVRGNQIERISTTPIPTDRRADTRIIHGGGRTLMPGLIDNHAHITMSAWSQHDALQPDMTSEKLEVRAAEEAEKMLMRGFTAVRDLGGPVFSPRESGIFCLNHQ